MQHERSEGHCETPGDVQRANGRVSDMPIAGGQITMERIRLKRRSGHGDTKDFAWGVRSVGTDIDRRGGGWVGSVLVSLISGGYRRSDEGYRAMRCDGDMQYDWDDDDDDDR